MVKDNFPEKSHEEEVTKTLDPSEPRFTVFGTPAPLQKGDKIGQYYEIYGKLGSGSYGIVYLAYSNLSKGFFAVKTYHDKFFQNEKIKERFKQEAGVWIKLDYHPNLVRAYVVEDISNRLYITMEYIPPDSDGINTLEGYLREHPCDIHRIVPWGIQFCYGMEFAYDHGIRCHGDIKPSNIMITKEGILKITDFGLSAIFESDSRPIDAGGTSQEGKDEILSSTGGKVAGGTPSHMSPEQFLGMGSCDERSDIYSLGIVLYQMATGGETPFIAPSPSDNSTSETLRFWKEMQKLHTELPVPEIPFPLYPVIRKCLEKKPGDRYQHFRDLRNDLEKQFTGPPAQPFFETASPLEESVKWGNKALSCFWLNRLDDSLLFCEKSLEIEPGNVRSLNLKGLCFYKKGDYGGAITWYDKATGVAPEYSEAWNNKGLCYDEIGNRNAAYSCYKRATDIRPNYAEAWSNLGAHFIHKEEYREAIACYGMAIKAYPNNPVFYREKAQCLLRIQQYDEALECIDLAINNGERDPGILCLKGQILYFQTNFKEAGCCYDAALALEQNDPRCWNNKGLCCLKMHNFEMAHTCFLRAITLDPIEADYWNNHGTCYHEQGMYLEAVENYDSAIRLREGFTEAWGNKGLSFDEMNEHEKAILCYDMALSMQPLLTGVLMNKGSALNSLMRYKEAIICFEKILEINPESASAWYNIGWSLVKMGRKDDSVTFLKKAFEIDPALRERG